MRDEIETVIRDIGSYKNHLITLLQNSQEICELLLGDNYSDEDVDNMVYDQLYPYLYVDETQTEVKSYLCFEVDIPRIATATIKDMKIIIWAYCHKACMKYAVKGYLGTRVDILADMVERVFHDSRDFGIGKLRLESVTYFFPNSKYYGRQMIYTIPDFAVKDLERLVTNKP